MVTAESRREQLKAVYEQARGCTRCPQLVAARQSVVFGAGNADADLMFVGEAPGANEDKQGLPFVGQAGKLLEQLLGEIGLRARATSSSRTSSSAGRPATATRSRARSPTARTTCTASSS